VPEKGVIPDLIEKIFRKTNGHQWDKVIAHAEKALTIIAAQPTSATTSEYFKRRVCYFHSTAGISACKLKSRALIAAALDHLQKAKALTKNPKKLSIIHLHIAKLLALRAQPKEAGKTCDLCKAIEVLKLAPDCSNDNNTSDVHRTFAKFYQQRARQKHAPCVATMVTRSLSSWLGISYSASQELQNCAGP